MKKIRVSPDHPVLDFLSKEPPRFNPVDRVVLLEMYRTEAGDEIQTLGVCDATIKYVNKQTIEMAIALLIIHARKLYKLSPEKKWGRFLKAKYGFGRSYAKKLIDYALLCIDLSSAGITRLPSEPQARVLLALKTSPEILHQIWLTATCGGAEVKTETLDLAISSFQSKLTPEEQKPKAKSVLKPELPLPPEMETAVGNILRDDNISLLELLIKLLKDEISKRNAQGEQTTAAGLPIEKNVAPSALLDNNPTPIPHVAKDPVEERLKEFRNANKTSTALPLQKGAAERQEQNTKRNTRHHPAIS